MYEISKRLVARGHSLEWISCGWAGSPSSDVIDGIRVRRFPGVPATHLGAFTRLRTGERPDVVIDDLAHALPWGSHIGSRIPVVVFFRHRHARTLSGQVNPFTAGLLAGLERKYARIYSGCRFVTEAVHSVKDLLELGIPYENCVRIPPGVDSLAFRPGIAAAEPTVVYFGGLRRYKRPDHAIRAFEILKRSVPEARLVVVGDGPSLTTMKQQTRDLGLAGSVRFLGRLDYPTLADVVRTAWVNIHCSVAEGWCLSAMEAAACGVPTAAYAVAGVTESIKENVSGLLARDGVVEDLGKCLGTAIQLHGTFAQTARARALEFSWDNTALAWERTLAETSLGASGPE